MRDLMACDGSWQSCEAERVQSFSACRAEWIQLRVHFSVASETLLTAESEV